MAYGVWRGVQRVVVYGVWGMGYGVWCTVSGVRGMVLCTSVVPRGAARSGLVWSGQVGSFLGVFVAGAEVAASSRAVQAVRWEGRKEGANAHTDRSFLSRR